MISGGFISSSRISTRENLSSKKIVRGNYRWKKGVQETLLKILLLQLLLLLVILLGGMARTKEQKKPVLIYLDPEN